MNVNRNSRKRMRACLALGLMLSVSLSACSGGNTQQGASPAQSAGAGASGTAGASPGKPVQITVMRGDAPIQPLVQDSPAQKEIESHTNMKITLEGVPNSDYDAKVNTLIATNNLPDVVHIKRADLIANANSGIFLDISPYIDQYAPNFKAWIEKEPELNKLRIDGDFYGFPIVANKEHAALVGSLPMIRTDILQKLSLKAPTSFDELYAVLKAMKAAYPDSYPWTIRNGAEANIKFLAYAFGSGYSIYYEPTEQQYVFGPLREKFGDVLTYMNKLYKEGLLDPNFATNTAQQWQQNLSSGKSFFFFDNYTFATNFNLALQEVDKNASFDLLPVLSAADGTRRSYADSPNSYNSYAISAKTKNPEAIVKMFDWMYSDEGVKATNFGTPGEHFTEENGKIVIAQSLIDQFSDKSDPYRAMQSYTGTGLLAFAVVTDDTPMLTISPEILTTWSDRVKAQEAEGAVQEKLLDPPFTTEERDRLKQLNSSVNTILTQNIDKFILGTRPLGELSAFAAEVKAAGAVEIEQIYNTALKRMNE